MSIGILAYGSLIEDPGVELEPLIIGRRRGIETPFCIEFARVSSTRSNAPTVVPVKTGGAPVRATVLLLNEAVSLEKAEDLLWRRETRQERSEKHYIRPSASNKNRVSIEVLFDFHDIDFVIYTSVGANIPDPTIAKLAEFAINSAKEKAGVEGKDGISYLISLKRQDISTPLMPGYEREILRLTGTTSLEEALTQCCTRNF